MTPRHITIVAVLFAAGCSMPKMPDVPTLTPHKMDVQQGNVVTQEMISRLQSGMTRSQVRFALGTPLVVDPFHANRWDYVYRYDKRGEMVEYRRIVVIFEGDKLARIEGDVVPGPAVKEGAAKVDKPAPAAAKPATAAAKPKPEVAAPQPGPEPAPDARPAGTNLVTSTGEPVAASGAQPAAGAEKQTEEKAKEEAAKDQKPQEERGFFGRMLDRLGF